MKLYESEAKALYRKWDIPVPKCYGLAESVNNIEKLKISYPVMLKSMVLVGGRGKAGGIKRAENLQEAGKLLKGLFKLTIKGLPVQKVMFEEAVPEAEACYLGVTIDPGSYEILFLASPEGGVEIVETAKTRPERILKLPIEGSPKNLPGTKANEIASFLLESNARQSANLKIDGTNQSTDDRAGRSVNRPCDLKEKLANLATNLYRLFQECDCRVAEINPLFLTPKGPLAADAKVVIDDNGYYRQAERLASIGIPGARHDVAELTLNEKRALKSEFKYVDLIPNGQPKKADCIYVGLVPGGAGYGIFSIDEVVNIGRRYFEGKVIPLNFMDSGGGPPAERVAEMFHLLMDNPVVDCIVTSRFGGISSCDTFIRGLIDCLQTRHARKARMLPVYGRMVGTDLASARTFLEKARQETPEPLADLHIEVGNTKIMAEVIREGLGAFIARKEIRA